jgi:hypothetical protein
VLDRALFSQDFSGFQSMAFCITRLCSIKLQNEGRNAQAKEMLMYRRKKVETWAPPKSFQSHRVPVGAEASIIEVVCVVSCIHSYHFVPAVPLYIQFFNLHTSGMSLVSITTTLLRGKVVQIRGASLCFIRSRRGRGISGFKKGSW